MMTFGPWVASFILLAGSAASGAASPVPLSPLPPAASHKIDSNSEIQPLFEASCVQCHAKGKNKGGFTSETIKAVSYGEVRNRQVVAGAKGPGDEGVENRRVALVIDHAAIATDQVAMP